MRLVMAALTATCLALAACGPASTEPELVYIPKSSSNPYFDRIVEGLEAGCAQLGCKVANLGPATSDATSQLPIVNAQIQRGVAAILITPNSNDALNRAFDRAREKGIKVIMLNSDILGFEGHRDAAVMPVDFARVGPSLTELMGKLLGYSGKFAILSATTDAPDQNRFIAGIEEALEADPKFAQMELARTVYGDDEPQKSTTETEVLLSSIPDLKGILAPTAVGIASAAQVVASQGAGARVAVTGLGTPDQMRRYVKDGTVKAFQLWDPYEQGLAAAWLATGLVKGTLEANPGASFDVPGLGTLSVRENGVVLPREDLLTFTGENIDDYHF